MKESYEDKVLEILTNESRYMFDPVPSQESLTQDGFADVYTHLIQCFRELALKVYQAGHLEGSISATNDICEAEKLMDDGLSRYVVDEVSNKHKSEKKFRTFINFEEV